ncbi:hypothetical protein GuL6_112 [Buttiauxella phage vB_ButM_GuL6]|nr:hypothetical protein GuL6_112 [Buttiauxella phage vB_ButM_GuL6]
MAYVSKKIEIIASMMGKTLNEIDRSAKNFKEEVFRLPDRQIKLHPYFDAVTLLINNDANLTGTHYIVGNVPYMFVFKKGKLIAYFDRANLGHVYAIIENINRYEDEKYTETTRRTTYGKITSMLEHTKTFEDANIDLIDDLLKRINKFKESFEHKKVKIDAPVVHVNVPSLASFEEESETVPVLKQLSYVIEIAPSDLEASCKALNNAGIKFSLYNKLQ